MWSETERDLYLSLAAEESRDLSFALQDLSRKRDQEDTSPLTGPATPEHTSSRKDECGIGDHGFDFWDQFMECYIAGEGGRELQRKQDFKLLQDVKLERDFEAFIDS